jgi:hypothetical protein
MNVSPANTSSADGATRAIAVTSVLSAIVFREILKPLTAALGPVGDALSDRVADTVLARPKT